MKVASFRKTDGGCDWYRVTSPLQNMAEKHEVRVVELAAGDAISKIVDSMDADAFLLPRAGGEMDEELSGQIRERGIKFVTDYDDNLFNISPFSPHYLDFGLEEVKVQMKDGRILELWKDGTHFDIKKNQALVDSVKRMASAADGIFVTTEIIAEHYKQYNDKVYVTPNSIDLNLWQDKQIKRDNPDEIRIYWSGGSSHYEDLVLLKDVFPAIMKKYPDVKLVLMGMNFKGATRDIPEDKLEFHEWVSTSAYPYKTVLIDADISLIPLGDSEFNRCKSNIKWVEQGALLVPSVSSLVSPYKEWYNGTNGVFVENNTVEGWIAGISYLIENPIDRWKMGAAARNTVETHFDVRKNCTKWYDAFKEITDGK